VSRQASLPTDPPTPRRTFQAAPRRVPRRLVPSLASPHLTSPRLASPRRAAPRRSGGGGGGGGEPSVLRVSSAPRATNHDAGEPPSPAVSPPSSTSLPPSLPLAVAARAASARQARAAYSRQLPLAASQSVTVARRASTRGRSCRSLSARVACFPVRSIVTDRAIVHRGSRLACRISKARLREAKPNRVLAIPCELGSFQESYSVNLEIFFSREKGKREREISRHQNRQTCE